MHCCCFDEGVGRPYGYKKATLNDFRILKDTVGDVLLTHTIVAGRLSVEIFRTSEHFCFAEPQ